MAATLALAVAASPAVQGAEREAARTQNLGTGVGALVGAVLAGPPGLIAGAFGGTLLGREVAHEGAETTRRAEVARLSAALGEAQARLAAIEAETAQGLQLASAAALTVAPGAGGWGLAINVQFRTASAEVEPHYHPQLEAMAALARELPGTVLVLEGHADRRGPAVENQRLSEARVQAVRRRLEQAGVDGQRIRPQAFGEQRPLFADEDLESRGFERRVLIRIEPAEVSS